MITFAFLGFLAQLILAMGLFKAIIYLWPDSFAGRGLTALT